MSISRLYFRGRSTGDFEGVTVASCDYGDLESKRADEDIAGTDGTLVTHINGRHYRAREITIVFNVLAAPATIEARLSALREWLSEGRGELSDDYNTGWVWSNAEFRSAHTDYIDMHRGCAQLTVKMTADPRAVRAGSVNDRVFGFAANGGVSMTLTDNSAWSYTIGSAAPVTGSYTAAAPYRYRLEAYTENPAEITLNGSPLTGDTFTLENASDDAVLTVTHTGFGWYAIYHDTREERL